MPTFTYTGTTKSGEKVKRTVTADDRFGVYDIARLEDHEVASIEEGLSLIHI